MDPILGVTADDVVKAMQLAANYTPTNYLNVELDQVRQLHHHPAVPGKEHLTHSWGWLDASYTQAILTCLKTECPPRSPEITTYMATLHTLRSIHDPGV